VGSGNFTFTVPIVSYPGRGESRISLSLVYNSRLWQKVPQYPKDLMVFDIDQDWPAPGWQLSLERLMLAPAKQMLLVTSNGTRVPSRMVSDVIHEGDYEVVMQRTTDGSLIDFSHEWGPNVNKGQALYPDGRVVEFEVASADGRTLYPTAIIDRNGNAIRLTYREGIGPYLETITDPTGRIIRFSYDPAGRLTAISGPSSRVGADIELARLHYSLVPLNTSWNANLTAEAPASALLIDAIVTAPTGQGFWFGDPGDYSGYGMLRRVRSCVGMAWAPDPADPQGHVAKGTQQRLRTYNYPEGAGAIQDDSPTYTQVDDVWLGQDGYAETTSFSSSSSAANGTETKITYPDRSWTIQRDRPSVSTSMLLSELSTYDAGGTMLRTIKTIWELGDGETPRVQEVATTNPLGTTTVSFEYGPNNQVHGLTHTNGSGALTRRTVTDYLVDQRCDQRHLFNLPTKVHVFDGTGVPISCTEFTYGAGLQETPGITGLDDRYNPETSTWVPAHDEKEIVDDGIHPPHVVTIHAPAHWEGPYVPETAVRGLVTQVTQYIDPAGPAAPDGGGPISTHRSYDLAGNLVRQQLGPQQITWVYDTSTDYALATEQTAGSPDPTANQQRVTTKASYNPAGLVATTNDANACLTEIVYADDGFRPELVLLQSGAEIRISYDDAYGRRTTTVGGNSGEVASTLVQTLDGLGRLSKGERLNAEGGWDIVEYQSDARGRDKRVSAPYRKGEQVMWGDVRTDPLGRVVQTYAPGDPDPSISRWFYDETWQPSGHYDYKESNVRSVDPWGRQRWAAVDEFGRLTAVVEPDPAGDGNVRVGGSHLTEYNYTATSLQIGSNPHKVHQQVWLYDQFRLFRYDGLGRLIASIVPERAATCSDSRAPEMPQWCDTYTYDDRGNMTTHTDPRGIVARYQYLDDPLDRLCGITCDLSGFTDTAHPVAPAPDVLYVYEDKGDVRRVSGELASGLDAQDYLCAQTYIYDPVMGLIETSLTFAGLDNGVLTLTYEHDSLGRVTKVTHPAKYGAPGDPRPVVEYVHCPGGAITTMSVDGANLASGIRYDPAGNLVGLLCGPEPLGQSAETYTWDRWHGWLDEQSVTDRDGTSLLGLVYHYLEFGTGNSGKSGQATGITDTVTAANSLRFSYDALGRLTRAVAGPIQNGAGVWTQIYTYDLYGNRIDVTPTGADQLPDGQSGLTVDVRTNHITAHGWIYDAAGNVVERPDPITGAAVRFGYDAAGRLVTVGDALGQVIVEHVYGVCHRRRATRRPATGDFVLYAWDVDNVIGEYSAVEAANPGGPAGNNGKPTWQLSGYFLGPRLLASTEAAHPDTSDWTIFHPDRRGTRFVTRPGGAPNAQIDVLWSPYGAAGPRPPETPAYGAGFAGYTWEPETGIDYAAHRFYDPAAGRYLTTDPLGQAAFVRTDPQSLNAYQYVGDDPINRNDPLGLLWEEERADDDWWSGNGWSAANAMGPENLPDDWGATPDFSEIMERAKRTHPYRIPGKYETVVRARYEEPTISADTPFPVGAPRAGGGGGGGGGGGPAGGRIATVASNRPCPSTAALGAHPGFAPTGRDWAVLAGAVVFGGVLIYYSGAAVAAGAGFFAAAGVTALEVAPGAIIGGAATAAVTAATPATGSLIGLAGNAVMSYASILGGSISEFVPCI
jgi:RHS repeat-associated protein